MAAYQIVGIMVLPALNSSRAALVLFNPKTPIQVRLGRQSWLQIPCSLVRLGDDDSTSCGNRENFFLREYQR